MTTFPTTTNLTSIVPKGETVWVTYYGGGELLFFLTGPASATSTMAAQASAFTLYSVSYGVHNVMKVKKLGNGGNPTELENRYGVSDAIKKAGMEKAS